MRTGREPAASSILSGDTMRASTKLLALSLIASLAIGCSETPKPASEAPKAPVIGGDVAKNAKGASSKRRPKDMGAMLGPESTVD